MKFFYGSLILSALTCCALPMRAEEPIPLQVSAAPAVYRPSRIGINLGHYAPSGTAQILRNQIPNPGFEGTVERAVLIVSQANPNSFSDEAGLGYEDNYWSGATFIVHTGSMAGLRGIIKRSLKSGEKGFPQYFSDKPLPEIPVNSVIVLTRSAQNALAFWEVNDPALVSHEADARPDSPGKQSVRLSATRISSGSIRTSLDRTAIREGSFVLRHTPWRLTLWARTDTPMAELTILLRRQDQHTAVFEQTIYPTTDWLEYSFDIPAGEQSAAPLVLSMRALKPGASVWMDDLSLEPQEHEASAFRQVVVELLKSYRPSYIREFPHLADTFENRIAPPFARKSVLYRSIGMSPQAIYDYSLGEFLDLCEAAGAYPWIVVPLTFSDDECAQLGQFLVKNAHKKRFGDLILEFGADNWNWLFRPMTLPYPDIYGQAASRAFAIIKRQAQSAVNVRYFVNGPYSTFRDALKYFDKTTGADGLAIAPYFFPSLQKAVPDSEILRMLFKKETRLSQTLSDHLFSKQKYLTVSEVNFHTLQGDAKSYERNRLVAGAASGGVLVKHVLEQFYSGADPVLVNGLVGLYAPTEQENEEVALWGVIRDFGPPARWRPTGLALMMLNQVIGGNLYALISPEDTGARGKHLTSAAFKRENGWTAALVSAEEKPVTVKISFPKDEHPLPQKMFKLEASDPFQTNETEVHVRIVEADFEVEGRTIQFVIPPWGFVVLSSSDTRKLD